MSQLINSVVSLSAMGLAFGAGLSYAASVFAVETDPKEQAILEALPGANCGGCGFPGCSGLASAIAKGEAPTNACPVGGAPVAEKVAEIMGGKAGEETRIVAKVLCKGTRDKALDKAEYAGITDCRAAMLVAGGGVKTCEYGCMGFGTCEAVCPFDAIHVNEGGVAVVDEEKCVACGKCVVACPKQIIELKRADKEVVVECMNKDIGKHVRVNCSVACIACRICEKSCPFDAIHVTNNLAKVDYDKCTECMICVEKCPTKAICGDLAHRTPVPADIMAKHEAAKAAPVQK